MPKNRLISGAIALFIIAMAVAYFTGGRSKKSLEATVIEKVMEGFSDETAQTRFMSYATKVTALKRLELAKINQLEVFERSSQAKLFWEKLNLPDVVVRATVPVEYRYYVELESEGWQIELKDNVLTIIAPPLTAGTPSPDVSQLRFEVRKGSFFRNEGKVANALQKELTSLLEKRAEDSSVLATEAARKQIALLAKQWLSEESKNAQILVRFANESKDPIETAPKIIPTN